MFTGGNVLESALLYFGCLLGASLLLVLFPFNLGDEFLSYAQSVVITSCVVLLVTSVLLHWGLKLCRVPISFQKALTINCFISGAYVLALSIGIALATSLIAILAPDSKQEFAALTLGCIPIFAYTSAGPALVAPAFGFAVHAAISLLSFAFSVFLTSGVFVGLAPYRKSSAFTYCLVAVGVFALDYVASAAFSGLQINTDSAYCRALG